jgi:hypothetical protein
MSLTFSCPARAGGNRVGVFARTGEIAILGAMNLRRRLLFDLGLGLILAALAMGVVYWQAATQPVDSSAGHTFRLLCPLH